MADHTITLNNNQEVAATSIVTELNKFNADDPITIDKWMKSVILVPIRVEMDRANAIKLQDIQNALPNATNNQLSQIKTILGIP